jgi:REP element-mobilizing transposase RayT
MEQYPIHWPHFYTATILDWKYLLQEDNFKDIIISSLQYLVTKNKIKLYAFVIMSNHIHLIWQALSVSNPEKNRLSFMKYTAQQMKFELMKTNEQLLKEFKVDKKDRAYQFWKREALSIELFTEKVFMQKLEYIHNNPVKAGLCKYPEDYKYSSASFYNGGIDYFEILTSYI